MPNNKTSIIGFYYWKHRIAFEHYCDMLQMPRRRFAALYDDCRGTEGITYELPLFIIRNHPEQPLEEFEIIIAARGITTITIDDSNHRHRYYRKAL